MKTESVKSLNPFKSVILTIYDIITKGHGGTIECESVEGVGITFALSIPI
jgi:light-regulated signal transduction histidine kinase (bacteriophytochrome)